MAILATKGEDNFKKVNPGTYVARCFSMIEIGTITSEYMGQIKKQKKVMFTWELPDELEIFNEEKGLEPFAVSKTYTLSMYDKSNLRHDLESWRGQGFTDKEAESFDVTKLLGVPCLLSVIHKPGKLDPSKSYVEIASISGLGKSMTCPPQMNPTKILSFDNWNQTLYDSLSQYLRDKIASSDEYKAMNSGVQDSQEVTKVDDVNINREPGDDLPF